MLAIEDLRGLHPSAPTSRKRALANFLKKRVQAYSRAALGCPRPRPRMPPATAGREEEVDASRVAHALVYGLLYVVSMTGEVSLIKALNNKAGVVLPLLTCVGGGGGGRGGGGCRMHSSC